MNFEYARMVQKKKKRFLNQTVDAPLAAAEMDIMTFPLERQELPKSKPQSLPFLRNGIPGGLDVFQPAAMFAEAKGDNSASWVAAALLSCHEFTRFRAMYCGANCRQKLGRREGEEITKRMWNIKGGKAASRVSAAAVYSFQVPPGKKFSTETTKLLCLLFVGRDRRPCRPTHHVNTRLKLRTVLPILISLIPSVATATFVVRLKEAYHVSHFLVKVGHSCWEAQFGRIRPLPRGGSSLEGLMRNPHSSFAACSPPDRKRMRQNNASARDDKCSSLLDCTSWDSPHTSRFQPCRTRRNGIPSAHYCPVHKLVFRI